MAHYPQYPIRIRKNITDIFEYLSDNRYLRTRGERTSLPFLTIEARLLLRFLRSLS